MFLIKLIKAWLLKWTVFGLLEDYDFEELVPSMFGYFKRENKKKKKPAIHLSIIRKCEGQNTLGFDNRPLSFDILVSGHLLSLHDLTVK